MTQPKIDVAALRRSYARAGLTEEDASGDPVEQFDRWFADAVEAGLPEPNAMVLATADATGAPSARVVLLKGYDASGLVFYTNYTSRKGEQLAANPRAALVFPWFWMERQVRVEGPVTPVTAEETQAYFASRPHGSQLGAWASPQSQVVAGRDELQSRYDELAAAYPDGTDVPVPSTWGGYRVTPAVWEFWAGRESRMHDRLRYRREGGVWVRERLAP